MRGSGDNPPYLLLPDETRDSFSRLENELLDSFPAGRVITLDIDKPADGYGWEKEAGRGFPLSRRARRRAWRLSAPWAGPTKSARCCAVSFSGGVPLDHVELIHTSRDHYVPLIYEVLKSSNPGYEIEPPVTFADGVPSRLTRPGRALDAWLRWVGGGYEPGPLLELVSGGLLMLPEDT